MNPTPDFAVRPARSDDAEAIWQIQQAVLAEDFAAALAGGLPPEVARQMRELDGTDTWAHAISAPPPGAALMVATRAGRVVGYGTLTPLAEPYRASDAQIDAEITLDVRPVDQRQGHGSRLLAALMDAAAANGMHAVMTWSVAGEAARTRFFPATGFAPLGIRRELEVGDQHVSQVAWYTTVCQPPAHGE